LSCVHAVGEDLNGSHSLKIKQESKQQMPNPKHMPNTATPILLQNFRYIATLELLKEVQSCYWWSNLATSLNTCKNIGLLISCPQNNDSPRKEAADKRPNKKKAREGKGETRYQVCSVCIITSLSNKTGLCCNKTGLLQEHGTGALPWQQTPTRINLLCLRGVQQSLFWVKSLSAPLGVV
jgi:hypothetical protein